MTYQSLRESLVSFPSKIFPDRGSSPQEAKKLFLVSRVNYERVVYHLMWKRAIDIAFSLAALILLSPVIVIVAILVKVTSPGAVLFKQERIGINRRGRDRRRSSRDDLFAERRQRERRVLINYGKPFLIYKFRSMRDAAESGRPQWAIREDPRITPLGKIIRKTRIDELPQFINVLKGDMSLVGPRPERAFFIGKVEKDIPEFQLRLRAKPGITGLAQVELGYTNDTEGMKKKLHFDLHYLKNLNFRYDLKIILKTFGVVITGKGAC